MYNNIKLTIIFALEWFGIFSELPANNICILKMPTANDIGFKYNFDSLLHNTSSYLQVLVLFKTCFSSV